MPSAVFLSTVNVGVATGLLVMYLYNTVSPPKGSVITAGLRLLTYTFLEIKVYFSSSGFLDIEKCTPGTEGCQSN